MKKIPTHPDGFIHRAEIGSRNNMKHSHFHSEHELYFLEEGTVKYFVGTELFILHSGDFIFIPAGMFHQTSYDTPTARRVVFSFPDDYIFDDCRPFFNELFQNKHVRLPKKKLSGIHDIVLKSEKEHSSAQVGYTVIQKLLLNELTVLFSRFRLHENNQPHSPRCTVMQNAAEYICENINENLSLNSIAEKFAMSPCHFSKQFRTVTGIGLSEYITLMRISAAEKLLAGGTLSVTEVAMRCGYNDSNYFAAVFKRIKGITPKKYSLMMKNT